MKQGALTITGSATPYYASFRIGVANGEDADGDEVYFGSETTVSCSAIGDDEVEVQIDGLSPHPADFGRLRAQAYLKACDVADAFEEACLDVNIGDDLIACFIDVARRYNAVYSVRPRGAVGASAWVDLEELQ